MTRKKKKEITFAVIDAETDPFLHGRVPVPFMWGFFDGDDYEMFRTTEELADKISNYEGIIYAHNGGKFDFHFLLPWIEPYEEMMIINGRIAKMKIGLCELRDSWLIIPAPLAAYEKTEIDYSIFEADKRNLRANDDKIRAYLRDDCVFLHQLIRRFVDDYGMNLTQAGSSMKQWKKIAPVDVAVTDQDFYQALSPYYYGGRVECFEKGIINADFSVFDINSAYPFAMLQKHPYSANYGIHSGYSANADFYRLRCVSRGALPFRGAGMGLAFPSDDERREYTVTQWEYHAAIETGALSDIDVIESICFVGHLDFSEYINKFYAARMAAKAAGDKAGTLLYKLAMNSLYGKFAANPENYKNYMAFPMDTAGEMHEWGWHFGGELGPWALGESPLDENKRRYYNVATGASITGFVRAMLWRAICASDGVLYCDTDSIAVKRADLPLGPELGQWKHEGDFDRAGIAGKKLYVFQGIPENCGDCEFCKSHLKELKRHNKIASKGVRITEDQLWQLARGKEVTYNPMVPTYSVKRAPQFVSRTVKMT